MQGGGKAREKSRERDGTDKASGESNKKGHV